MTAQQRNRLQTFFSFHVLIYFVNSHPWLSIFSCDVGHICWNYQLEDGRCVDSMALVTAKQYGIDAKIVQRAAQLAQTFDALCRPDETTTAGAVGASSVGKSDYNSDGDERLNNNDSQADTDAEDNECISIAPPSPLSVLNNKTDKLHGRRYNLNTDVLPIMRPVCADSALGNNIQVRLQLSVTHYLVINYLVILCGSADWYYTFTL